MNLETKITIYKFTPQVFTLTPDFPVFQRLAQYFKYISIELRQLNITKSLA